VTSSPSDATADADDVNQRASNEPLTIGTHALRRWQRLALVVVVIVAVIAVRGVIAGSSGLADCPTGRPMVHLTRYSPVVVVPPDVGSIDPSSLYQLDVDFEVTNRASEAIVVERIEAGVLGHSEMIASNESTTVEPRAKATVHGSAQVLVTGLGEEPVPDPDPDSVSVDARWANDDLSHCDLNLG